MRNKFTYNLGISGIEQYYSIVKSNNFFNINEQFYDMTKHINYPAKEAIDIANNTSRYRAIESLGVLSSMNNSSIKRPRISAEVTKAFQKLQEINNLDSNFKRIFIDYNLNVNKDLMKSLNNMPIDISELENKIKSNFKVLDALD